MNTPSRVAMMPKLSSTVVTQLEALLVGRLLRFALPLVTVRLPP